jgi:hypothetical protein
MSKLLTGIVGIAAASVVIIVLWQKDAPPHARATIPSAPLTFPSTPSAPPISETSKANEQGDPELPRTERPKPVRRVPKFLISPQSEATKAPERLNPASDNPAKPPSSGWWVTRPAPPRHVVGEEQVKLLRSSYDDALRVVNLPPEKKEAIRRIGDQIARQIAEVFAAPPVPGAGLHAARTLENQLLREALTRDEFRIWFKAVMDARRKIGDRETGITFDRIH